MVTTAGPDYKQNAIIRGGAGQLDLQGTAMTGGSHARSRELNPLGASYKGNVRKLDVIPDARNPAFDSAIGTDKAGVMSERSQQEVGLMS